MRANVALEPHSVRTTHPKSSVLTNNLFQYLKNSLDEQHKAGDYLMQMTPHADSALSDGNSFVTGIKKLVSRCDTCFSFGVSYIERYPKE
ncbi:hypothetical protein AVEN_33437-1 [Araneus ventricosus]|uniref:Uncharacterized protein n=1 Tax=Araneus ventricosus TaxID=182803 RepID=A0A4Y2ISK5_ARAVE|nr:hypothetical protein AVEN_33437-1 [Araneus ventricosus]